MSRRVEDKSTALVFVGKYTESQYRLMDSLSLVLDPRLAHDLQTHYPEGSLVDKTARQQFLKTRTEVYLDAIRRGKDQVLSKLGSNGLRVEILEGLAYRCYQVKDNQTTWKLDPKASDPFERGTFFKEAKSRNLAFEGRTDPATDPYLLDEVLKAGLAEQEKLFGKFQSTYQGIVGIEKGMPATLSLLTSLQDSFVSIKALYQDVEQQSLEQKEDKKDLFAAKIVGQGNTIEKDLDLAARQVQDVLSIHGLYIKEKTVETTFKEGSRHLIDLQKEYVPVERVDRAPYERSLVILLLTAAEPVSQKDLQMPKVEREQVVVLNEFLKKAKSELSNQDYEQLQALLIYRAIETRRDNLSALFVEIGISADLGLEYVFHLMLSCLKTLPDRLFQQTEQGSEARAGALVALNHLYRLNDPTHLKKPTVDHSQAFVDKLFQRKTFEKTDYAYLSNEERILALEAVFTRLGRLADPKEYDSVLTKLFQGFNMEYDALSGRFSHKAPRNRSIDEQWAGTSQTKIYQLLLAQVEAGDQRSIDFLEARIIQKELLSHLQDMDATTSDMKLMRQASLLNSQVNNKFAKEKISRDEASVNLSKRVGQFALWECYKKDASKAQLGSAVEFLVTKIVRWVGSSNKILINLKMEADFTESALVYAQEIINNVTREFFGPNYPQNRRQAIKDILSS